MEKRTQAVIIGTVFLIGSLGFFTVFNHSIDAEIELNSTEDLKDGAGYESINITVENNDEIDINPRFYIIEPTAKGPHRLFSVNKTVIESGETEEIVLRPHNYTYITAEQGEKYTIVMKDLNTGRTTQKTINNKIKIKNGTIRNTELVSFGGKPPGWKERFKGSISGFKFDKNMRGVQIERISYKEVTGSMGYYLVQDFKLTEKIVVEADYENLGNTSTGFRVLYQNSSTVSDEGVIEVDFTENNDFNHDQPNTYDLREIFNQEDRNFQLNRTMQLQFFYEAGKGERNRFFIDSIEPTNKKT